ncbi:hypothetical protein [Roseobacter phage RDJL6]|nr:hypothetical protein [Roseobacter phage RDJL6]
MGEIADQIIDGFFNRLWDEGAGDVLEDFDAPASADCHRDNPRVTRALKAKAHKAFDRIWQTGRMTRSQAYLWLSKELGVTASEAHMAAMDRHEILERVIVVSDSFMGTPLAASDFPDDL